MFLPSAGTSLSVWRSASFRLFWLVCCVKIFWLLIKKHPGCKWNNLDESFLIALPDSHSSTHLFPGLGRLSRHDAVIAVWKDRFTQIRAFCWLDVWRKKEKDRATALKSTTAMSVEKNEEKNKWFGEDWEHEGSLPLSHSNNNSTP